MALGWMLLALVPFVAAIPHNPFEGVKRQPIEGTDPLQIDLGYAIYKGVANATSRLNIFKGIRFAAPPVDKLRWQAPQVPPADRSTTMSAKSFGAMCPQTPYGSLDYEGPSSQSEDCLFLNVYAPQNASKLPVLVWIHGGGYGLGDGTVDLSSIINTNDNAFVAVSIQYRLGAFGFLSSDEVFRNGVTNAGIMDQTFALQWIQSYIELFGGDPSRVTISGGSAGGGAVMLQNTAYGGTLRTSLFVNSITASPYSAPQYGYKDWVPSQSYYAFATAAGCPTQWAYGNSSQTIFQCLVAKDSATLMKASALVSRSGAFRTWAFLPVTDGVVIQSTPSQALLQRKINGINHLSGHNAEEGAALVALNIATEGDLIAWIRLNFPLFKDSDTVKLLSHYPLTNGSLPRFATAGDTGPTATEVSQLALGNQQRANNIYAETSIICPSYWLAEAYSTLGRAGYKYQYSIPEAEHGADYFGYFGPALPNQGADFVTAFQRIWGNFIRTGNPSISSELANGKGKNGTARSGLEEWPVFTPEDRRMANLNQTGGVLTPVENPVYGKYDIYLDPGLKNDLRLVDAHAWEGRRGERCDFWRSIGELVPQ